MTPPRMTGFLECASADGKSYALPDLHCPFGHRIAWEFAFHEAGYPRCPHQGADGRDDCNARLFLQFFPRLNAIAHPILFVASVSYEEIHHITAAGMDVPTIMAYLGLSWSPQRKAG